MPAHACRCFLLTSVFRRERPTRSMTYFTFPVCASMADEDFGFRVNEEYANKYNRWREKEELQRLKDKYGDVEDEESTSSSSDEDEDAEALNPSLEKGWLRALAAVKAKDPRIYDANFKFYDEDTSSSSHADAGTESKGKKKAKNEPMFLHDYERKLILEKDGILSDDGEEEEEQPDLPDGYYEEQEQIIQSIRDASQDNSDDELLTRRRRTKADKEKEDADYIEWLKGQKEVDVSEEITGDLDPLKTYWADPKLEEGEKFLRNYILERNYREDNEDRAPTYYEIVDDENLSEEEKEIEKQENFERKYNFRFEEPDPDFIKSYPRTIGESVRRKDSSRSKKRQEDKERKQRDKGKKMEELRQLKNMKKREILDKLERLKEITGNPSVGFSLQDVDGDFDPHAHDATMKKVFDEDYYEEEGDSKPVFDEDPDLDLDGGWDQWAGPSTSAAGGGHHDDQGEGEGVEPHCDDPNFIMDADYDPSQKYQKADTKKKKKKSKFAEAVQRAKPTFDPADKTFDEYLEEYYKLDYEDVIGDQPCRFKYRRTVPNSFGLSTEEILKCREQELNAWCSLKKMSQYRTEEEEKWDVRIYRKKAANQKKKLNILTSLQEPEETPAEDVPKKKRRKRKRNIDGELGAWSQLAGKRPQHGHGSDRKSGEASAMGMPHTDRKRKSDRPQAGPSKKQKLNRAEHATSQASAPKVKDGQRKETPATESRGKDRDATVKRKPSGDESHDQDKGAAVKSTSARDAAKKKKKKKKVSTGKGAANKGFEMSAERLKAYGIDPKKFKYTHAGSQKIHVTGKT